LFAAYIYEFGVRQLVEECGFFTFAK
jgi:hypothetical protein